jgi:hypothetical protein
MLLKYFAPKRKDAKKKENLFASFASLREIIHCRLFESEHIFEKCFYVDACVDFLKPYGTVRFTGG